MLEYTIESGMEIEIVALQVLNGRSGETWHFTLIILHSFLNEISSLLINHSNPRHSTHFALETKTCHPASMAADEAPLAAPLEAASKALQASTIDQRPVVPVPHTRP